MAFTDAEKSRIKHFLSYPDWVALAASIQLGFPAGSQPLFLVEDAFQRLTEGGESSVRRDLCECESIESQISQARSRFKATQIGTLRVNPNETRLTGDKDHAAESMFDHAGRHRLCAEKPSPHIDVEQIVPRLNIHLEPTLRTVDARIVDKDIYAP